MVSDDRVCRPFRAHGSEVIKVLFVRNEDGGAGGHTVPPHTTERTTTNLKTKNNQNGQKIKLYGSLATKELKKKHSSRLAGRAEMGSWVERTRGKAAAGGPGREATDRVGGPTFTCS